MTSARAVLWDGPDGGAFDDAVNWTGDTLPDASTSAELGDGMAVYSGTIVPEMSVAGLTAASGAFTMTAGTLNNSGGGNFGTGTAGDSSFSMTGGTYNITGGAVRFGNGSPVTTFSMSGDSILNYSTNNYFVFGASSVTNAALTDNAAINLTTAYRLYVGDSAGSNATLKLSGNSSLTTSTWNWIGWSGGTGALILDGDEDSSNGQPTFTVTGTGAFLVAEGAGTHGSVTLNGDANFQMNGVSDHGLVIGHNAGNGTFTMNGTSTASSADDVWIGNGNADSVGEMTLNDSAAFSLSAGGLQLGRGGSTGSLTLTGSSSFTSTSTSDIVLAQSGNATASITLNGHSTFTAASAKIKMADNTTDSTSQSTITLNDSSAMTVSRLTIGHLGGTGATATVNVNDSSMLTVSDYITLGRDDGTGFGVDSVLNINGGTVATKYIQNGGSGGTGAHIVNIDGGTLKALEANENFFPSYTDGDTSVVVNIEEGGLTFDTAGFTIGIGADMGGVGGLTVIGGGELDLNVASSYTGDTVVGPNTILSLSSIYLFDSSTVSLMSGSTLELTFTGTDTIGGLFVEGMGWLPNGVYDSTNLSDYISGDGSLTVVPEPTTVSMGVIGMLGLSVLVRRFRRTV